MRAVVIRAYGGLDQVRLDDVPRPALQADDDVIVALKAAALNHLDLHVVRGLPGLSHTFPHVLGADGAGTVEAAGPAVTRVKVGDAVLINPGISCGRCEWCQAGEHSLCASYALLGEHLPGTFAEAVRVPQTSVTPLPREVPWGEAAAFPLVHLTAWRMLTTRARVRPGETVLIWGIGGGVALAALGIAKLMGARVIVTSSSDEKLARAKALGADETVNHASSDVPKEVRRLTDRRGADVIIDSVGQQTWEPGLRCLARQGRLASCGATSGPGVAVDARRLFWYQYNILGSTMGSWGEFEEIVRLLGRGALRPVIDRSFPLAEAGAAFARMARGDQFGKLVLEVTS